MAKAIQDSLMLPPVGGTDTNMLSGLLDNPELLAIVLDKIGQGFAPKNPFAGVGTLLGQTSLADKARNQTLGLTPPGQAGPTSVTTTQTMGPDGRVIEKQVINKELEGAESTQPTQQPTGFRPETLNKEQSLSLSGGPDPFVLARKFRSQF